MTSSRTDRDAPVYDIRYWSIERWIAVATAIVAITGFYFRMQSFEERVNEKFMLTQAAIVDFKKEMKEEVAKLETRELAQAKREAMQKQIDENARRIDHIDEHLDAQHR